MPGFLVGEEGALSGLTITLEDAQEWILGRDPDVCYQVLEDPMVSRKHVLIRLDDDRFILENLSATNPALINGELLIDPHELHDDDLLRIGSTLFRFKTSLAASSAPHIFPTAIEPAADTISELFSFTPKQETRWLLKVTSGPHTGAEFSLEEGQSYTIGKDPSTSMILFQDVSVSRNHAKLTVSADGTLTITDMASKNGVLVNGYLIEAPQQLESQDAVVIGTNTFVVIDRFQERETLFAPLTSKEVESDESVEAASPKEEAASAMAPVDWKQTFIPNRHLAIGALLALVVATSFVGIISLFHEEPVQYAQIDENKEIKALLEGFPAVTYTFDPPTGKLFIVGHVLTDVQYQELSYLIKTLPFIRSIDDNVIIDEYVWQNINALLFKNPDFRSVLISSQNPGQFILRGFVQTQEQQTALSDFVNMNFPYLDKLSLQVVVEDNIQTKIQSELLSKGFSNVTFQLSGGEIVFSGRLDEKSKKNFIDFLVDVGKNPGIRQVKNFVILSQESSSRIDLTSRYSVTGSSKLGQVNQFVLINGRILSVGDFLDGMEITQINPREIFLDRDGMKYKIDYNLP